MPGFVKPTRKVVNIEDAFGELIGKKLIKDLHDNEEICPVCHGIGLRIEDNPYGLSDDPDKRTGQFPYKHQSTVTRYMKKLKSHTTSMDIVVSQCSMKSSTA